MKLVNFLLFVALASSPFAIGSDDNIEEDSKDATQPLEKSFVLGNQRAGDYRFITEDTEKLVTTAGSLGDPLGAITALPGVIASETGQDPAVRGSSPDDNVFYVDFLPSSYIFHEFGVSVFSEYILHDFDLYAAGFGPEYAGATGATFDVNLRQPKNQKLSATIDLSMLRSGVFFEGAVTERSAFYLSARRSLIDLFIQPEDASDEDEGINVLSLPVDNDYQFKYAWNFTDNTRLTFSANGASDEAEAAFTNEADFVRSNPDFEGNAEIKNSYDGQHILFEHFADSGKQFKLGINTLSDEENVYWGTDFLNEVTLDQFNIRGEYRHPLSSTLSTTIGLQYSNYDLKYRLLQPLFICTEFDVDCDLNRRDEIIDTQDTFTLEENSAYLSTRWTPIKPLTIDLGVQFHDQKSDTAGDDYVHPRIALAWSVSTTTTFNFKAGSYNRFADLDTVLEQTGNPNLQSPSSNHYVFGLRKELDNEWSINVETYYKTLDDLPLALSENEPDAAQRYVNETDGESRGIEVMINKNLTDRWYGWISLSYAESQRTNLRTQQTTDYFLDTPVIFNWVMNYQRSPRFNVSSRLNIRSGTAYTPIVGVAENPLFENSVLPVYGEPYSDRLPIYSRLDLRFKWDLNGWGKESSIILDILNVLNRKNVVERSLDFERVNSVEDEVITEDTVGLGIIPALSYRVRF